jgi:membrane-associated phospholipid phosphatase
MVLWLNVRHGPFWDPFFRAVTFMGDGVFVSMVVILLLAIRPSWGLAVAASTTLSAVFIQFLKREVFRLDRPLRYFKDMDLHLVDGVEVHELFSFPSGHSGGSFALFATLALLIGSRRLWRSPLLEPGEAAVIARKHRPWEITVGLLCVVLASLTALSRVYLVQHFFVDVLTGSIIGVLIALATVHLFEKARWHRDANSRLSRPLFGLFGLR